MRIAIANSTARRVGGAETYVERAIAELERRGHSVALLAEAGTPDSRPWMELPPGVPCWRVDELGPDGALAALREWRPELIYTQIVADPRLEARLLDTAPAVLFAHAYYGTCISGLKTHRSPTTRTCDRVFGPACLGYYFPRRCGGLNPVTMFRLYGLQSERNALLRRYRRVITASDHMLREYARNGVAMERLAKVPLPVLEDAATPLPPPPPERSHLSLLFLGRMDTLKGGSVLLDALPLIEAQLGRPVRAVFAGEGPARADWERRARRLAGDAGVSVEFAGWVGESERRRLLGEADLLVVPSLWPEPFGMVGPEAGALGVPAVAFAVGGIPEWLIDSVNGRLAPADPATAGGLARAVADCVRDPAEHARLREGAREVAERFRMRPHMDALVRQFEAVLAEPVGREIHG